MPDTEKPRAGGLLRLRRSIPPLLWAFVLALLVKQILVVGLLEDRRHVRVGGILIIATLGFTLVWVPWLFRLPGRWKLAALLVADLLATVALQADTLYFRQFRDLTSIGSLGYADHLVEVRGAVEALLRARDVWLLVDVAALTWLATRAPGWALHGLRRRAAIVLSLTGVCLAALAFHLTPRLDRRWEGGAYFAGDIGLAGYHVLDAVSVGKRLTARLLKSPEDVSEAKEALSERAHPQPAPSPLAGVARGRNVIVIQMESFQAFPVGMRFGGVSVTPRLDALVKESLWFPRFFAQTARGTTSDAEFLTGCSQYPSRTGAIFFEQAGHDLPCLPRLLRDRGYSTSVFHSNKASFWNRASMYPGMGYDRFFSDKDFEQDEKIGLGLSDESFLRQTFQKLQELPRPFYAFVITLTNHSPFEFAGVPYGLDLGRIEGYRTAAYLRTVHYTDAAVGHFVDRLRESGILDDSVLVIYGDHGGVFRGNSDVNHLLPYPRDDELAWLQVEKHVPLLIRLPGGAHASTHDGIGGEIDVAPTIASLVGAPVAAGSFLGRDLLRPATDPMVAWVDGSVLGSDRLYLSGSDLEGARCLAAGGPLDLSACAALAERAQRDLDLSRSIVEKDLYRELVASF